MRLRIGWEIFWQITLAFVLRTLTRHNQMRFATHCGGGLQIAQMVTDGRHALEVHAVALANLLEQAGSRFAASAVLVRAMWAEKHRVNPTTHST